MKTAWYSKKGSGGQGIVIDEADGRTVAVAYDDKDAALLAAAPDMAAALRGLLKAVNGLQAAYVGSNGYKYPYHSDLAENAARAALEKAGAR